MTLMLTQINEEAARYHDIVQENFVDSYKNLSIKSVAMAKWVSKFCPNATFLIKSDTDVSIRPHVLVRAMQRQYNVHRDFMIGIRRKYKPRRNPLSKWYVPSDTYQEVNYPEFVLGPTYGYTVNAAASIYNASMHLPLFSLEDVFVTGMCRRLVGIPLVDDDEFTFTHSNKL